MAHLYHADQVGSFMSDVYESVATSGYPVAQLELVVKTARQVWKDS